MRIRRHKTSSWVKDRYNAKHYEQVNFRVGIGGREILQELADESGLSLAAYLRHLVVKDAQDRGIGDISAKIGGGGKLTWENFSRMIDI